MKNLFCLLLFVAGCYFLWWTSTPFDVETSGARNLWPDVEPHILQMMVRIVGIIGAACSIVMVLAIWESPNKRFKG